MSEDHLATSSFGEPNAQPPTSKHTPTSATFASPVFETPNNYQGSFTELGGLTPRFAEEYSVFNATPGNLRGTQGSFPEFVSATSGRSTAGHKRLLSAEGLVVEITTHVNRFSPNPAADSPTAAPANQLSSSPDQPAAHKAPSAAASRPQLSPDLSKTPTSTFKKARRSPSKEEEPVQVISPPPTARKGERKLAPDLNMQNDPIFGHPEFQDPSHQEMAALMGTDMFGYPMSAPAATQSNFWDPSMSMNMDLDFTATGANMFQPPPASSHRHTGSFDWNSEIQLFQDQTAPPSSNQENVQPSRQETTLVPKSFTSDTVHNAVHDLSLSTSFAPMMEDTFRMMDSGEAVDPGLLFSRPQITSTGDAISNMVQSGSAEAAIVQSGKTQEGDGRGATSGRGRKGTTKAPDRATAAAPAKASCRPGLGRSVSENRGRKNARGGSLPVLAPAARPASGPSVATGKSTGRLPGRISPFKTQQRLSSLASIPETSPQVRQRTSVRFSIDAYGRATVETTVLGGGGGGGGGMALARSRSSHDLSSRRSWSSAEDDSDTDDEPIIIPSRNNSFNTSFALPDPRKPVGSIFHSSSRSISDRSNSNSANEAESEAETVVNEKPGKVGDAASELRKVVEDRQKRSRLGNAISLQRSLNTKVRNFPGGIISPTSLTESSYGPDNYNVRCVCNNSKTDESDDFMVQCESCEMWLHGKCINITRRTMPSVYICGFCANTPNMAGRRARDNALGIGSSVSPLAKKSFRSFR